VRLYQEPNNEPNGFLHCSFSIALGTLALAETYAGKSNFAAFRAVAEDCIFQEFV
jgi:hypothetical protein